MTRKAAVAEAIEALGGVQFLLANTKQGFQSDVTYHFDTSGEGGFPWNLSAFYDHASGDGRLDICFIRPSTRGKKKQVRVKKLEGGVIDVAYLDSRIALAGAPNRQTYNSQTTYKRRGPASSTLLSIYREAL